MTTGRLIIVGTPIGNLGDISERAKNALETADFIAAEDTRVTVKLMNHLALKKPLMSYFEHNKEQRNEVIYRRIQKGETCVLVSDAGMPAISDPGVDLVALCAGRGVEVSVVPGPSAVISALSVAGMACGRFAFEGFLTVNKKNRINHLEDIAKEPRTMVFYEAPHKLSATLRDLLEYLGDRRIAIVRELTKIHEEVIRTNLANAVITYGANSLRGEIVLIVDGYAGDPVPEYSLSDAIELTRRFLQEDETLALKEACKLAAKDTGIRKSDIYKVMAEEKETS